MHMTAKNHRQLGFTLIELIIAIAIVGFFSSFMVVNFRANEKVRTFKNQAMLILDGVKKVQTMALSGTRFNGQLPKAYGFTIDACQPGNCRFNLVADPGGEAEVINLETVNLDERAGIDSGAVEIFFFPPRAEASIKINGDSEDAVEIKLINVDENIEPLCVKVNRISGRMDIGSCVTL